MASHTDWQKSFHLPQGEHWGCVKLRGQIWGAKPSNVFFPQFWPSLTNFYLHSSVIFSENFFEFFWIFLKTNFFLLTFTTLVPTWSEHLDWGSLCWLVGWLFIMLLTVINLNSNLALYTHIRNLSHACLIFCMFVGAPQKPFQQKCLETLGLSASQTEPEVQLAPAINRQEARGRSLQFYLRAGWSWSFGPMQLQHSHAAS